jgi:hypothetical protein
MFCDKVTQELDRKGTVPYTSFGFINWEAMDLALSHCSLAFCAWVTKHVTGECGVGQKMIKWNLWDTHSCPCCKAADETTTHYPFCKAMDMILAYDMAVEDFSAWMIEVDTDLFMTMLKTRAFHPRRYDAGIERTTGTWMGQSPFWPAILKMDAFTKVLPQQKMLTEVSGMLGSRHDI